MAKVTLVEKKSNGKRYAMKSISKKLIIEKEQIKHTKTEEFILTNVFL
jgi:hypothetical protein